MAISSEFKTILYAYLDTMNGSDLTRLSKYKHLLKNKSGCNMIETDISHMTVVIWFWSSFLFILLFI